MSDKPIAHREDGSPIFDNTPTVVVVAVIWDNQVLVIRRNTNPGKGLIALPGGYHMRGESWQMAGAREVFEETGVVVGANEIMLSDVITDSYGNNVILSFAELSEDPGVIHWNEDEVQLAEFIDASIFMHDMGHWAFPTHMYHAVKVFEYLGEAEFKL